MALLERGKPRGLPIAVIACEVSGMDTVSDSVITGTDDQWRLVRALTNPALYGPGCTAVRVVETHISYVLLTGRHAYKIKKAVDLGFLDFASLAARHFYCDRELELNRRLAPAIYLEVVAITGAIDAPRIGGDARRSSTPSRCVSSPRTRCSPASSPGRR